MKIVEKIEVLAGLLKKSPNRVVAESLDLYLKVEREKSLRLSLDEHRKETNLSYDAFWDDSDFN